MAVMFFILAAILYRSRNVLWHRLKNFFTTKRTYTDDDTEGNSDEAIHVFLLISISAISLSCMFLDDRIALSSFLPVTGIPYWLFGAGFVMCMAFIYFKAWLYLLVNWVFFDRDSSQRWIVGYLLVVVLYELLLFYKLITNFRVKKYGYMLIFLYFCSVELLPTLVFGHLAVWLSDSLVNNILY